MAMDYSKLALFAEICRKIGLNIPEGYQWQWDRRRDVALITLDKADAELVFFPLFKEFRQHWNFSSPGQAETLIARLLNSEYGLMPGQFFFTSRPIDDLVLFVAWWPWGRAQKVSMRLGLFSLQENRSDATLARACLGRWLNIAET